MPVWPTMLLRLPAQFQVPFHLKTAAQPIAATEAAARQWRYQALTELAITADCSHAWLSPILKPIALKRLLYNLIRGTGADGLQALTWERSLQRRCTAGATVAECFARQNRGVLPTATATRLGRCRQYRSCDLLATDSAPRSFPYLQTHFNPQVEAALAQTAEILQAEVAYLGDVSQRISRRRRSHPYPPNASGYRDEQLHRQTLRSAPVALQRRVLRIFLQRHGQRAPTFNQIEQLVALIECPQQQPNVFSGKPLGARMQR